MKHKVRKLEMPLCMERTQREPSLRSLLLGKANMGIHAGKIVGNLCHLKLTSYRSKQIYIYIYIYFTYIYIYCTYMYTVWSRTPVECLICGPIKGMNRVVRIPPAMKWSSDLGQCAFLGVLFFFFFCGGGAIDSHGQCLFSQTPIWGTCLGQQKSRHGFVTGSPLELQHVGGGLH